MTGAQRRKAAELGAAIILSLSAFVSSWAGYQANLWDGEQAAHYAEASAARVSASRLATVAGQYEGADILLFSQWLAAHQRADKSLELFYRRAFRPEFASAVDAWLKLRPRYNRSAPASPFLMPNYHSQRLDESRMAQRKADLLFVQGQKANDISDGFENGTVFLALAMFLCGIAQTFESVVLRTILLTVGGLACLSGILRVIHLPTLQLHLG